MHIVGFVFDKNDKLVDLAGTWETCQTLANEGFRIQAIGSDGHMLKEEIQKMCDSELAAAIDCFGEGHRK